MSPVPIRMGDILVPPIDKQTFMYQKVGTSVPLVRGPFPLLISALSGMMQAT